MPTATDDPLSQRRLGDIDPDLLARQQGLPKPAPLPPPNPHSALLGTLQSPEPGDPELRTSTDAPRTPRRQLCAPGLDDPTWNAAVSGPPLATAENEFLEVEIPATYERQPDDPDPAGTTLVDLTLNDIARMDAVAHDADPSLVVNLGGQNAIADTGVDLEGRDHQTPNSEHLDSLVDVGDVGLEGAPANDPWARFGQSSVEWCVRDALRSWSQSVIHALACGPIDSILIGTSMTVSSLHLRIILNLRINQIDTERAWPLVLRVIEALLNPPKRPFEK